MLVFGECAEAPFGIWCKTTTTANARKVDMPEEDKSCFHSGQLGLRKVFCSSSDDMVVGIAVILLVVDVRDVGGARRLSNFCIQEL